MFPTKNMMDYMTEINRLFPKTTDNGIQSPNTSYYSASYLGQSPVNPTMANQSSSSADSTSPESFPSLPEMSGIQFRPRYTSPEFQPTYDTPYQPRRQRPIMGRKIMANPDHGTFENRAVLDPQLSCVTPIKVVANDADLRSIWAQDLMHPQTPPKTTKVDIEQGYGQNVFYELFPAEHRGFEFKTPDKKVSPLQSSRFSSANISPSSGLSMSPVSPVPQRFMTPPPHMRRNFLTPVPPRFSEDTGKVCSFCRKNGETPLVYMTHTVKERIGNRNVVTCPILRSHVCATCHATGDDAHTITYCPVLRSNNNGLPLQSTTITLKNTRVKSNGRKRY